MPNRIEIPSRDFIKTVARKSKLYMSSPDRIEAAEKFIADGYQVAFVGTRDERWDAALLREVSKKSGVTDLTGQTTLSELLTLMKHAALVISNDTGPAHLSIALGAPTIVIVGGGHFSSFVPYPEHRLSKKLFENGSQVSAQISQKPISWELKLTGAHWVQNSLAVVAALHIAGKIDVSAIG